MAAIVGRPSRRNLEIGLRNKVDPLIVRWTATLANKHKTVRLEGRLMTRSLLYCRNRGEFRSGRDFGELEEECFETRIGSEPRAQFR
jgi:hypothetical protein